MNLNPIEHRHMKSLDGIAHRTDAASSKNVQRPVRTLPRFLSFLLLILGGVEPLWAANIAPEGTGILGVNDAIDADSGTPRVNGGVLANINDANPTTRVDNWFGGDTQIYAFVGVTWPITRYDQIQTLALTLATFSDGGWFGVGGFSPEPGEPLLSFDLFEPTIQVTTDGGVTWTAAPHTSDYVTVLDGHMIGGGANPNPTSATAVFTLNTPATQVNGIRIIGENGGLAGADENGFLGVFELEIEAQPAADTDGDGMPDAWEQLHGLVVGTNDADADPDQDGLTNLDEFEAGTHPNQADTDGDGLTDGAELATHLTNPLEADTDGDGLSDGDEVNTHETNPTLPDTDGDGLSDGDEVNTHLTNPLSRDTDADTFSDGLEVAQGTDPLNPASYPSNAALTGTGIMGINDAIDGDAGTPRLHAGLGAYINDGDPGTRVDNWFGEGATDLGQSISFVGVTWPAPLPNYAKSLTLTLATFSDGGWFGVAGAAPGGGGALPVSDLIEPTVQVSTDGGITWTTVAHTSDYLAALTGHGIGGGANPNPTSVSAVFTLTEPATGITGIRIIGENGGNAGPDPNGFIGVFELEVTAGLVNDVDGDGMDDTWESSHGLNVGVNDAADDPDDDGLSNIQEFAANTDPQVADTDGDGLSDGTEVSVYGTNPLLADTDGDGLDDGQELNVTGTDPLNADSDGDGLNDGDEVNVHLSDPNKVDTDDDGFDDATEVAAGTDPNSAASVPGNVALIGTAIIGTKASIDSGTEVPWANAGVPANINDGNPLTRVDTWNGGEVGTVSYVGMLWIESLTRPVLSLDLSLAIFFDGGWFGVNGVGPGTGGTLAAATHLTEPTVQVSTNGGGTWTTVSHTSDYLALDGHPLPTVDFGPPTTATATFTLDEPATGINGIRIIGSEGGTASGGFIGVFELAVQTQASTDPQSTTLLNLALGGAQFQFEFDSQTGTTHNVWSKSVLTDDWQLHSTVVGDGTRKTVTDTLAGAQRFYRVSSE